VVLKIVIPMQTFLLSERLRKLFLNHVAAMPSSYISFGRSLEAKIVMFGVVGDVRKRVFFLSIMWQHVVGRGGITPLCH
jgi:hypothetical protein